MAFCGTIPMPFSWVAGENSAKPTSSSRRTTSTTKLVFLCCHSFCAGKKSLGTCKSHHCGKCSISSVTSVACASSALEANLEAASNCRLGDDFSTDLSKKTQSASKHQTKEHIQTSIYFVEFWLPKTLKYLKVLGLDGKPPRC